MRDSATSLRVIDSMIDGVRKHYSKANTSVQVAALAIMEHAKAYGDCDRAKVLARAVPARERNSLIGWFSMFSPIGIAMGKTAKDDRCRFIKPESKSYNKFNLDGARANMWYDDPAGANPEPKPLSTLTDFYYVIDNMLKKAIADCEKGDKYAPEEADRVKSEAESMRKLMAAQRAATAAKNGVDPEPKSEAETNARALLDEMVANAKGVADAREAAVA